MSADTPAGVPAKPIHPWLVLLIGMVAPGSGHWAAGNIQRGMMFAWFMFVLGVVTWHLIGPEHGKLLRLSGGILIWGISVLDAYKLGRIRWTVYRHARPA
jgi:hypothetical protein